MWSLLNSAELVAGRSGALACSALSRADVFILTPCCPRLSFSPHPRLLPDVRFLSLTHRRGLARQAAPVRLHRSFLLLGVSQHAEPREVREAYIKLAKVYHPDSGSPHASNDKFSQVSWSTVTCIGSCIYGWSIVTPEELVSMTTAVCLV